ncbi:MAG: SPOR domain-containing protein [Sulfuritalea sp.]|jgi:DedD protein|nr:SPOR domain-containing protein [Sulfuritalea sp.]
MDQIPPSKTDPAADLAHKRSLVNTIVVVALAVVGLIGGWVMFDAIYTPGQPLPLARGVPPKNVPGAKSRPESAVTAKTAEPAAPELPAAPGAQAGEAQFVLQMGVSGNAASAEELRAKLERHGIPSTIETRVSVGPFSTREGVDAARAKLQDLGLEGGLLVTTTK